MLLRRAIVGVIAVGLALGVQASGILAGFEDASVDQRFRLRPASQPPDVVLVGIDARSLDLLRRRPPLPRSLHGRLLDRLRTYAPSVIAYDLQITEPTTHAEDDAMHDAVSRARPVVLVTAEVYENGDTAVFGGTKNVEAVGGRVATSKFPLALGAVYRRVEPEVDGLPSLAFAAAEAAGRKPRTDVGSRGLIIDYAGPAGAVRTVPFVDVLRGHVPASVFRGKAVVVGETALSEARDFHRTPVAEYELMSGPEIQANALSTVLRGTPLRDAASWTALALAALLAAWGSLAATRLSPGWLAVATVGTSVVLAVASYVLFASGVVVEVAAPMAGLLIGVGVGGLARELRARRRAHELRDVLTRLAGGRDVDELIERVNDHELVLLSAGARFGDYEVDRALGVGAMSVVHLARHRPSGRLVALKVMAASLGDRPQMRDRFVREAQAANSVDHDAVVPIVDAGEIAERPYLAMQFIDGGTLADLVRAGSLTVSETVELLRPIAEALDHAHRQGVIHRDVKPSNILVDGDGRSYLADFGIAHLLNAARMTMEFVGTPAYTPPEQVRGSELTGACDQYALACVLFECLTGRVPFAGPIVVALMQAHLEQPPPAASAFAPALGSGIDAVLRRGLAKQPEERYCSCVAMLVAAAGALGAEAASDGGRPSTGDETEPGHVATALETEA